MLNRKRCNAPLVGAKTVPNTLTEIAIRAAKPPAKGTTTLWDASLANFGCRISPKGTKSFIVLVASGRRQSIGRYPILSLAQARLQAKRILAAKTLGKVALPSISVQDALAIFFADSGKTAQVSDGARLQALAPQTSRHSHGHGARRRYDAGHRAHR